MIRTQSFLGDARRLLSPGLGWKDRSVLEKAYTAFLITVLVCLLPLPYDFYTLTRAACCVSLYFFLIAILPDRKTQNVWFFLIIAMLVLYNPIIPVRIGDKGIWTAINLISLYALYRARREFDRPKPPQDINA